MILGAGSTVFKQKPIETSSIEAVNCRPAIRSVTHVSGSALLTSNFDEAWNEPVVAVTVDGGREESRRDVDAASCKGIGCLFGFAGKIGAGRLFFQCECAFALNKQSA